MKPFKAFTTKADKPVILPVLKSEVLIRQSSHQPATSGTQQKYEAIWDTGAMMSAVSPRVINDLGLKAVSMVRIHAAGNSFDSPVYKIDVMLPNNLTVMGVMVSEANVHGADMLIGMDVISTGDLAITHAGHRTCFSFRFPPADDHIDYVQDVSTIQRKMNHKAQMHKMKRKGMLR